MTRRPVTSEGHTSTPANPPGGVRHYITADLIVRCQNAAKLYRAVHTDMGRTNTLRIGREAAAELARRGVLAPLSWDELERSLDEDTPR